MLRQLAFASGFQYSPIKWAAYQPLSMSQVLSGGQNPLDYVGYSVYNTSTGLLMPDLQLNSSNQGLWQAAQKMQSLQLLLKT